MLQWTSEASNNRHNGFIPGCQLPAWLVGWLVLSGPVLGHDANAQWNSSNTPENPGRMVAIATSLQEWAVGTPSPQWRPPFDGFP